MSAEFPIASEDDLQGRIGVLMVGLAATKKLGWVFREKPTSDIGIDGEIEARDERGQSHGRIIALQIKCGPSYFKEQSLTSIKFRADYEHLRYWAGFSIPVLVVLCDQAKDVCYWQLVDLKNVSLHQKGWSMDVPKANVLDTSSKEDLERVAARLQKKDLIELALRDWIGWRFQHEMRLASILAQPRDYWWFSHLGRMGTDFYMIDYVTASVDGFDEAEIDTLIKAINVNRETYDYGNVLLAFVSESEHHLKRIPHPPTVTGVRIEFVPLLLDSARGLRLRELGADGAVIDEYEVGLLDEQCSPVIPARKISEG